TAERGPNPNVRQKKRSIDLVFDCRRRQRSDHDRRLRRAGGGANRCGLWVTGDLSLARATWFNMYRMKLVNPLTWFVNEWDRERFEARERKAKRLAKALDHRVRYAVIA